LQREAFGWHGQSRANSRSTLLYGVLSLRALIGLTIDLRRRRPLSLRILLPPSSIGLVAVPLLVLILRVAEQHGNHGLATPMARHGNRSWRHDGGGDGIAGAATIITLFADTMRVSVSR